MNIQSTGKEKIAENIRNDYDFFLFFYYPKSAWSSASKILLTNFASTADFERHLMVYWGATFHALLHDFGAVFTGNHMIAGFEEDFRLGL